jgi:surface antigen
MLQDGQEIFVPITLEKAYDIWMMERPKPVYKPKTTVAYKPTITKPTTSSYVVRSSSSSSSAWDYSSSSILSSWVFNKNINNKFYAGHCTWYVAATTPQMFPYTSDTTQARPFGWNANQRYNNAKAAWFSVGTKPVAWSIIVYRRWGGWYASAGHVAKVISYNAWAWTLVVEEMNGSKKFVVQRRTDRVDNPNIIWYIYMPSTPWTPN